MTAYIIRRILLAIPLLVGITMLTFGVMHMAPGGPTSLMLDPDISTQDLQKLQVKYGFDDPLPLQYLKWLGNIIQGDFGTSFIHKGEPVSQLILNRLPNTFLLMLTSSCIAIILAIPLGVISATKPYSTTDYSITALSFMGVATPNFWLGLILIMIFSVHLGWLPAGGVYSFHEPFRMMDRVQHLLLPAVVLATADLAGLIRYTRSSMLEVLTKDYIRTARAKGISSTQVIYKHGLRNGLIPVVTVLGLMLPSFFGGAVIIEKVFAWPGVGLLFLDAVFQRDYPVIMAITLLSAVLVVIGNLIADITYALLDPRIEYN